MMTTEKFWLFLVAIYIETHIVKALVYLETSINIPYWSAFLIMLVVTLTMEGMDKAINLATKETP